MKRTMNHEPATYGLYLSTRPLDLRFVGADGEALDGRDGASYRRIPTWLAVLVGPILGGLFVIAFPLIAIVAFLGTAITAAVRAATHRHAYVARSTWQPAVSFFDAKADDAKTDSAPAAELGELHREVSTKADAEKRDA